MKLETFQQFVSRNGLYWSTKDERHHWYAMYRRRYQRRYMKQWRQKKKEVRTYLPKSLYQQLQAQARRDAQSIPQTLQTIISHHIQEKKWPLSRNQMVEMIQKVSLRRSQQPEDALLADLHAFLELLLVHL